MCVNNRAVVDRKLVNDAVASREKTIAQNIPAVQTFLSAWLHWVTYILLQGPISVLEQCIWKLRFLLHIAGQCQHPGPVDRWSLMPPGVSCSAQQHHEHFTNSDRIEYSGSASPATDSKVFVARRHASERPQQQGPQKHAKALAKGTDIISYNTVISKCAQAGDVEQAEFWLRRISVMGLQPTSRSYSGVINACAKQGLVTRAEYWLETMVQEGLEANVVSYSTVISACARSGDTCKAEHWLSTMLEAGVSADVVTYSTVIDAFAKIGDVKHAEDWLQKLLDTGMHANEFSYSAMINACAKAGDLEKAEEWVSKMISAGMKANLHCYNMVINACSRSGNAQRAVHWFQVMSDNDVGPDIISYNTIITAYAKKGDVANAEAWLKCMDRAGIDANAISYNKVISACVEAGQPQKAESWLERLQKSGVKANVATYHVVAQAYATVGCVEGTHRVLCSMVAHKLQMDSRTLSVLLTAFTNGNAEVKQHAIPILRHWIGGDGLRCEQTFRVVGRALGFKAARLLCNELKASTGSQRHT